MVTKQNGHSKMIEKTKIEMAQNPMFDKKKDHDLKLNK